MSGNLNYQQGAMLVTESIVVEWSGQLKQLLETKHLYQKVEAQVSAVRAAATAKVSAGALQHVDAALDHWLRRPLEAVMKSETETTVVAGNSTLIVKPILLVTNVKLFCGTCGGSEVYYPLWARDVTTECRDPRGNLMPSRDSFQMFFLAFQCQVCHSDPEGFIVRRSGYKLYLEGRSPIEEVQLPKFLPKKEMNFLSDAVVAFNAGKKLAGLFYLRTFLEQYARRITGIDGRASGEELMDAYSATLPPAHRDYMPSFRSLYEKLSEAIHEARSDEPLFESVRADIERHFDIRRVFAVPEVQVRAERGEPTAEQEEERNSSPS